MNPSSTNEAINSLLTHLDARGQAHVVYVAGKQSDNRVAVAEGQIQMQSATFELIQSGTAKKGDALRIARIMAANKTSDLIPFSQTLALTRGSIEFKINPSSAQQQITNACCTTSVETISPTGVEMEAQAAVQVAQLTIYEMCKAVEREIVMTSVRLLKKHGGNSGSYLAHTLIDNEIAT